MNNIRFINWNKEKLDKELAVFEKEFEKSNIENITTTAEDQKFFWLSIFLPSIIAIACAIAIWIITGKFIDAKGLKMLIRIAILCIAGFFVATRTFKIFQMPVFASFLNPPKCPSILTFHKSFKNKTIEKVDYEECYLDSGKIVKMPTTVYFNDNTSYSFNKFSWKIMPTTKKETVIDVTEMMIFCTDVNYVNEE